MQRATAYQISGTILLHADSKTTSGLWILDSPMVAIGENDRSRVGKAILGAIQGSREGIPHPKSWRGSFDPVLKLAGVKTWNKFMKSARCVEIEFSTNRISFLPTRNLGSKEGFEHLHAKVLDSPPTEDELTKALLVAFEACE